jgi:DNA-binding NarL/FixJ family response regulator
MTVLHHFVSRPPPGVDQPAELSALSGREVEVLRAMAEDKTNADIAEALFLSGATVKTHVSHIVRKLGLQNRIQAVVLAYESGLGPTGDQARLTVSTCLKSRS